MEYQIKSDSINELEKKIRSGEDGAIDSFLSRIKHTGTPLIEKIDDDYDLVTFIYQSEGEIENVLLISPVDWLNLESCKMERLHDTNLWYKTYKLRNDLRLFYYFSINDSFDKDWPTRFNNSIFDIYNKNFTKLKYMGKDKEKLRSYAVMSKTKKHIWVNERSETYKGTLDEHIFYSKKLNEERRVRVYTPYGYNKNKIYSYLVLTDGEDYIDILSAKNILDNLIHEDMIPPLITIFIDSTENRSTELKCNNDFAETIVSELLPWARENYKLSKNPAHAIIGGLSLGGLFSSYVGLKYSNVFGNVLSQSGSYWYKPDGATADCWICEQYLNKERLPLKFYLNVGVLEHKQQMIDTNKKFKNTLIEKGYDVTFEEFKSGHDHLCWDETLANGLISLLGKKS